MKFSKYSDLENEILKRAELALVSLQEEVYRMFLDYIMKFYNEYDPRFYERTFQLYWSLTRTSIERTGNSLICYVYFDSSKLDYSLKYFTNSRYKNERGHYVNPFCPWDVSDDGTFISRNQNEEVTLTTALTGTRPHGGYATGTAIWTETMKILIPKRLNMFKRHLKRKGLPIR